MSFAIKGAGKIDIGLSHHRGIAIINTRINIIKKFKSCCNSGLSLREAVLFISPNFIFRQVILDLSIYHTLQNFRGKGQ